MLAATQWLCQRCGGKWRHVEHRIRSGCNRRPLMEKRSNQRYLIEAPIFCSPFYSLQADKTIDGRILNCCPAGIYAELKSSVKAGTIVVVRVTGGFGGISADEGLRSMALAEVRWSKPITVEGAVRYAAGLKYLLGY